VVRGAGGGGGHDEHLLCEYLKIISCEFICQSESIVSISYYGNKNGNTQYTFVFIGKYEIKICI